MIEDTRIGEVHGDLTIIAKSTRPGNGYLYYYWVRCKCGNIKRYRYDRIRNLGNCGMCNDFIDSKVLRG